MSKQHNPDATRLAIRHYREQIWSNRFVAIPALLLPGVGSIFVSYVPPLVVAVILRRFSNAHPSFAEVWPYLALMGGAWFLGEMIWRMGFLFLNRADSWGMQALFTRAMDELFKKDIGFFHNNFAGSLTKKTISYAKSYEGFMDTLAFNVFASLLPLVFVVVILWRYSPLLVLGLIGLMTLVGIIIVPLTKRRKKLTDIREEAANKTAGYIADVIGNMDAVQAFAHESYEAERHNRNAKDYMDKARHSWDYHTLHVDMAISPLYVLTNVVGLAIAITTGKNAATMSAIFVTFSYYSSATRILWEFNRIYRNIENALSEAAQFTALLLEKPAIAESATPTQLTIERGEIEFDHIDFAYSNRSDDPLFKDFNLHIQSGEKIALVGHSGGGKTTVTKLLLRFMDVTGGKLLIDKQNIADGRLKDLRSAIAFVPQEPAMFHRSIRENIRYGKLEASDEDVIEAAKKAHAHDFISKLPEGYDTMVGERGVKLSGGQRQRIAIARAIIKDAPILVLDEATSALDSESEKLIQAALWELMKNRTAIVIAHRLSTIQKMDRIIVLDDGAITEQGTHSELLAQHGTYATLWAHQSGGFIED